MIAYPGASNPRGGMHLMKFSSFVVFYFVIVLGVSSVKIVHLFYFGEVAELVDALNTRASSVKICMQVMLDAS